LLSAVLAAVPLQWRSQATHLPLQEVATSPREVPTIDFAIASLILANKQSAGEPQWLRVWRKAGDPLNLMRVMPPKGARVRCRTGDVSHARDRAWLFVL